MGEGRKYQFARGEYFVYSLLKEVAPGSCFGRVVEVVRNEYLRNFVMVENLGNLVIEIL